MKAAKPDAVFVFYPGAAGVQFLNQYAQAGLKGQIPLYTAFTIDSLSLPRQGENAIGVPGAQHWVADLPNDANKKFVADFKAKHKAYPSFYGAQSYDAANLINSAVVAVKGDLTKKDAMRDEMRKANYRIDARALQVRQQPLPDSELLPAGRGEGRRRHADAEDRGDHRQGQPGQARQQVPDEVVISGSGRPAGWAKARTAEFFRSEESRARRAHHAQVMTRQGGRVSRPIGGHGAPAILQCRIGRTTRLCPPYGA